MKQAENLKDRYRREIGLPAVDGSSGEWVPMWPYVEWLEAQVYAATGTAANSESAKCSCWRCQGLGKDPYGEA